MKRVSVIVKFFVLMAQLNGTEAPIPAMDQIKFISEWKKHVSSLSLHIHHIPFLLFWRSAGNIFLFYFMEKLARGSNQHECHERQIQKNLGHLYLHYTVLYINELFNNFNIYIS